MSKTKIADEFGKKIGGSKRDQWKIRGLVLADLADMNDAEKAKYVKKDNIWPKPDYEKLKETGIPVPVIYFRKLIKDSLASTPKGAVEDYISSITEIRDAVEMIKTPMDVTGFFHDFLVANNYVSKKSSCSYVFSKKFSAAAGPKTFRIIANVNMESLKREVTKKQFLFTEDEKILSKYVFWKVKQCRISDEQEVRNGIWLCTSYCSFAVYGITGEEYNAMSEEDCLAINGHTFVLSAESEDKAKEKILSLEKTLQEVQPDETKAHRKHRFVPKQLEHIRRIGGDDVRQGKNMDGNNYLETFHFYGGEFGNWMNENDRQASLNMGYEAFCDLAKALDISLDKIALDQELSIAFGARGSGKALAHYEPLRQVINLTKMNGAGSLAHEYGHALDNILCKRAGFNGFFTENRNKPESMRSLISVMKYKTVKKEIIKDAERVQREKERMLRNMEYVLVPDFRNASEGGLQELNSFKSELMTLSREAVTAFAKKYGVCWDQEQYPEYCVAMKCVEYLGELRKKSVPRAKKLRGDCENAVRNIIAALLSLIVSPEREIKEVREKTDFYKNSLIFDEQSSKEDKGYWASDIEMFARAFACYVKDRLQEMGMVNDYLCGHADSAISMDWKTEEIIRAYPEGEERIAINRAMDAVMHDFRKII